MYVEVGIAPQKGHIPYLGIFSIHFLSNYIWITDLIQEKQYYTNYLDVGRLGE